MSDALDSLNAATRNYIASNRSKLVDNNFTSSPFAKLAKEARERDIASLANETGASVADAATALAIADKMIETGEAELVGRMRFAFDLAVANPRRHHQVTGITS